jgi:hypothetical protein
MSDPIHIQQFIDFWDQHVSTWHPKLDTPPTLIHPSARLFNTLQDRKLELAEMLNRLQHTKCTPGYCQRKKKGSDETFVVLGFRKSFVRPLHIICDWLVGHLRGFWHPMKH